MKINRNVGDGSVVPHSWNEITFLRLHPPLAAACETPLVPGAGRPLLKWSNLAEH